MADGVMVGWCSSCDKVWWASDSIVDGECPICGDLLVTRSDDYESDEDDRLDT